MNVITGKYPVFITRGQVNNFDLRSGIKSFLKKNSHFPFIILPLLNFTGINFGELIFDGI